jgi:hypothetical protein
MNAYQILNLHDQESILRQAVKEIDHRLIERDDQQLREDRERRLKEADRLRQKVVQEEERMSKERKRLEVEADEEKKSLEKLKLDLVMRCERDRARDLQWDENVTFTRIRLSSSQFVKMRRTITEKTFGLQSRVTGDVTTATTERVEERYIPAHMIERLKSEGWQLSPGETMPPEETLNDENSYRTPAVMKSETFAEIRDFWLHLGEALIEAWWRTEIKSK